METLTIDIPEEKSLIVRQLLKELGVVIRSEEPFNVSAYREQLLNVGTWSEDDLKVFEDNKKAFDIKPQEW